MIIIDDPASAARALERDLDPPVRAALERELALLTSGGYDLTEHTAVLIVEPSDVEADVAREAGLSVPLAGWDLLTVAAGVRRMVVTYGSSFATIVLIPDDADPALLALCRRHAA